ncbi:MAG: DUF1566 domain-containing protein [Actinobacteria bacterium]|nr:DUF1566 domain-containing protein [Actinomycetota bacterium]
MEAFSATLKKRGGFAWPKSAPLFTGPDAKAQRIEAKALGAGRLNTDLLERPCIDCIFIPSKDELDALFNFVVTSRSALNSAFVSGMNGEPWWTSTEASDTFAWYQLFNDGTQFTDANGIITGLAGNKTLTTSNVHKGSSFTAKPMRLAYVNAFAPKGVVLPPKPPRPVIPAGGRMSADCAAGRSCQVGDIGPGGGVVFYDAGKTESWGRYLEASPASCQKSGLTWRIALPGKRGTKQLPMLYPTWATAARQRIEAKRLGMGKANTALVIKQHKGLPQTSLDTTAAGYANSLVCGGKDDWFLPSKDELDTLYNVLALTDNDLTGNNSFGFTRGFYWTSSEYNNETAWTQLWVDGQQFDREKWLNGDPRKDGGFNPFHVRPIRAFG